MVRDLGHDLRFGVRALRRRPAFTVLVIGVLALGIGAVTSIFTLVDRLFFAPPAGVQAPQELVRLFRSWAPGEGGAMAYADFLEYRSARTLSGLMAYDPSGVPATARLDGTPAPVNVRPVSDGYFEVLGVRPARGRFITPAENAVPGGHPVVVASWSFWQEQLDGGDAVGRSVLLNGHPFTIIGVAPREFRGISPAETPPDLFIPILMRDAVAPSGDTAWRERLPNSFSRWLTVVGRLRGDATLASARAELEAISSRIRATYPTEPQAETVLVTDQYRWSPYYAASLTSLTRMLLAVVAVVLAIALANCAILLLVRASTREREIGIRTAMGAGRGRVARQLLAETAILALVGGAGGVLLSVWTTRITAMLLPARLERLPFVDSRVLLFALGLSALTVLAIGAAPALRATRGDVVGMVQGRGRGERGGGVRDALVVAQVALSLVLLAGAALFARSLAAARSLDLGFESENVLAVQVDLRNHGYDPARGLVFLRDALVRIRDTPGVATATTASRAPFRGEYSTDLRPWSGETFPDGSEVFSVGLNMVALDYFTTMEIPLVAGRPFQPGDESGGAPVIVVNETFANAIYPEGNALGQMVPLRGDDVLYRVIGVARDATYYEFAESPRLIAYGSVFQSYQPSATFLVKTTGPPLRMVGSVTGALHALDPDLALHRVETLEQIEAEQVATFRASAHVVGLSGLVALLLACAGLYGVMVYRVAERTREIGVRMALGATRPRVARGVLATGMRLALFGAGLGVLGALGLARLVRGLLFGIGPDDAISLIASPVILLAVAAAALIVPARRAMSTDPMRAIRAE